MAGLMLALTVFIIPLLGATRTTIGLECTALDQLQKSIDLLQVEANNLKQSCKKSTSPEPCGKDVIAYYKFDKSFRDVCNGNNAVAEGSVSFSSQGILNGAASFTGSGKLRVSTLNNYAWGSRFSVSLWFKRTGQQTNYQGLINNGYGRYGSWEIRMGREQGGKMIGGGVVTSNSPRTWDVKTYASYNHWHHVVMTYDGTNLNFYLDNRRQGKSKCCQGNIFSQSNDVVIGQAGHGMSREYFFGLIDEVKLFKKALTFQEVTRLYRLKNV